ncbi:AMP-binding protein [Bordetella genomosp. 1]|uniref:AMP-binding protein n=2 Tax=Bordetella genomosp. 1 TaxID=1395607 RepID=A0ABX4EWE1_9BORD|nr:AMP-binding protein [Bordetella genomosp. 1]
MAVAAAPARRARRRLFRQPAMSAPRWTDPTALLLPQDGSRPLAQAPALDHAAFADRALRLAASLRARGVRHAALWFDDAVELGGALYACWRAGVTAHLPGDVLAPSCARIDAGVDLWLADSALPLPTERICAPAALAAATAPLSAVRLDEDGAGLVLYTSGSSGTPKPIPKTWAQLAAEVRALAQRWPAAESLCVLGSVSAHHMFGLPFRVLWPLCAGHLLDRPQRHYPEELAQASLGHARILWIASPALLRRVEQRIDWDALRPRLAAIYTAGGPLPPEVSDRIAAACGCRPIEIYGSSETGAAATRQGEPNWQLLAGVQAGLDAQGALWLASPWTAGREQTADAATLTPAGLQLHGRLDRIVKLEEKRIGLPDVEQALASHPHVAEARVGLVPGQPRLSALIALSPEGLHALRNGGRRALVDGLRRHLDGRVLPLAVPRSWRLLRQLPWNAQGKLTQARFLELAGPRPRHPRFAPPRTLEDGALQIEFEVPLDLPVFPGHFPATPVVPGVVQIEWALAQARAHLRPDLRAGTIENLKFQRLMRPGDRVLLTLRWDDGRAKLGFSFHLAGEPCSSGRIAQATPATPAAEVAAHV